MEKQIKNKFIEKNTLFGLFMGLSFILTAYLYHISGRGITLNPGLSNVIMLLSIAGTFIGVRKYREEALQEGITYGRALGACVYLIAVAAVVYGVFIYILYRQNPGLQEDYINTMMAMLEEAYSKSPLISNMETMIKAFTTAGSIAFAEIFNKIFTGFIFSLFLAGILRKTPRPETRREE